MRISLNYSRILNVSLLQLIPALIADLLLFHLYSNNLLPHYFQVGAGYEINYFPTSYSTNKVLL